MLETESALSRSWVRFGRSLLTQVGFLSMVLILKDVCCKNATHYIVGYFIGEKIVSSFFAVPVLNVGTTPWRRIGEWKYSSTHSL